MMALRRLHWRWLALGLLWFSVAIWAAEPQPARVLLIASYHAGMPWSDAQIAGVRSELESLPLPVDLQVNFLDTKHVAPSPAYYQQFEAMLLAKYGPTAPKAIVVADDDALDFALSMRQRRFPEVPILFSGVASSRRLELQQLPRLGGVFDDLDVAESLMLMLDLHPSFTRVVVVHDQSRTSLAQVETLKSKLGSRAGAQLEYLTNKSVEQVQARLAELNAKELVFALPFNRDATGRVLSHEEATDLWVAAARAPIAVTRDVAMRAGVLGGFLVSGLEQGRTSGHLAALVLQGKASQTLPIMDGASHATVDYRQMQRWDIALDRLPTGASVLNRPGKILDNLRPYLPWLIALFGSLLVIIGLLLYVLRIRKKTEANLRLNAHNFEALFNNSPDAVMVRDMTSGEVVETNPRFREMFGYAQDEVRQLSLGDLCSQELRFGTAEIMQWMNKTQREGDQFFEWRSRRKDGSFFWSEISARRFDTRQGQRAVFIIRDISERKQTEALAREFDHRIQQVYQNLPVAIFAIDAQHKITFWNLQMTRLTGVHADEVVGTTDTWRGIYPNARPCLLDFIVDGADIEVLTQHYPDHVSASELVPDAFDGESFLPAAAGGRGIWGRFCAAPLRDARGTITGAIETVIDFTQLKQSQDQLQALNQDLEARVAARNEELKRAMGQLVQSEKLAALGSLVAGIAHELNTPIGNVLAVASTLKDEAQGFTEQVLSGTARRSDVEKGMARIKDASALIERNAERAAFLIQDFKQVAVDQSSTRRRNFGLRKVVEEILATMQPTFKNVKLQIDTDIPDDIVLNSYPGPLEQVLTNFLANSVKHGFEGRTVGQIRIAARSDGTQVVVEYEDDGCGILAANLHHLFEPFYTTKLGQGGSGLGLYIVHNLVVNVLGGQVSAFSTEGRGTRFVLHLPVEAPGPTPPPASI